MELKTESNGDKLVFPLQKVLPNLRGYYITAEGEVFSTRKSAVARKLAGKQASNYHWANTRERSYTLDDNTYYRTYLLEKAKRSTAWNSEMVGETFVKCGADVPPSKTQVPKQAVPSDRSYGTVAQGLASNGAVIARVSKRGSVEFLEFSSDPKIHLTPESLKSEMTRLAIANPGVRYVALKIGQSVVAGSVRWS